MNDFNSLLMQHLKPAITDSKDSNLGIPDLENLISMMEKDGIIESKIENGEKLYSLSDAGKAIVDTLRVPFVKTSLSETI